jgi:hypothetical protein
VCDVLLFSLFSDVPDILEPLLPKSRDAAADDDLQRDSDQHASTASDSTSDKQRHGGSTQQSSDLTVFLGECWLHLPPVTAFDKACCMQCMEVDYYYQVVVLEVARSKSKLE